MKLQLKRSNVLDVGKAKEPTASQMEYGELAVNYNNGDPAIFIKDSNDNIIRIAGTGNINSGDNPSGDTLPPTGNKVGDIFFNTLDNTLYYWDGSQWVPIANDTTAADIFVGTLAEINAEAPAADRRNGFLWWNTEDGTLYVWYIDANTSQWVIAVPGAGGGGGASVTVLDTPPSSVEQGDLWWNTTDGRLYVWYEDGDTNQWVDASPDNQTSPIKSGPNFPSAADSQENDIFFNTTDGRLYIYYKDNDSSQWVDASPDSQTTPYWDRTGTTLKPSNDGDMVTVGTYDESSDTAKGTRIGLFSSNSAVQTQVPLAASGSAGVYDVYQGTNRTINFTAAGAAEFGSNVVVGTYDESSDTAKGTRIGLFAANSVVQTQVPLTTSGSSGVYDVYQGTNKTINFTAGGGATFAGGNIELQSIGYLKVYRPSSSGDSQTLANFSSDNNGTDSIALSIRANGKILSNETIISPISSERRLKENIVAVDPVTAWSTIKDTPYYRYNFIGSDSKIYGPMVDDVPPEMVVQPMEENEDGVMVARADEEGPIRTYDNGMLQARLYTALQTALTRIEALEAKVTSLEGGNN